MSHLKQSSGGGSIGSDDVKKRKRSTTVDHTLKAFRFKSFGENGYPVEFDDSFRRNVEALVGYGHLERDLRMPVWSFQLQVHRHPPFHVLLFVVEESIEASLNLHCNHCQYVGWGHHMICNKKYHFLIPSQLEKCNNNEMGKSWWWNLVELKGHLMHGVFHSNGFGHLLCVNAVDAGSDSLTGHQIMDLWDRLCTGLRARKISLNDTSQKRGMELRLLHGVAQSEPWFGRWGYKFGRGTYGITQPVYQKAIEAIQGIPLTLITTHLVANLTNNNDHYNIISTIFLRYQNLSEHSLLTLRNLFSFILDLKSRLPRENHCANSYNPVGSNNCRWSPKRVEMATRVIIEALKTTRFKWVSRQEVRDAARTYIGDTGLLDFVLKSLGNQIVGSYLVRRSLNPVTKVLEYCLEDISNVFNNLNTYYQDGNLVMKNSSSIKAHKKSKITKGQLVKDLLYLYKYILKDEMSIMSAGIFNAIPVAARIILDTKYFVKEYRPDIDSYTKDREGKLKLFCTVTIRTDDDHDDRSVTNPVSSSPASFMSMPPCEGIVIKKDATIHDLNYEVEKSFREIYWGLRSFVVKSVSGLSEVVQGSDRLVFESVEILGKEIVFEGTVTHNGSKDGTNGHDVGVYVEGGLKSMIVVDCRCGAKDDDGERMVSCDICEVWQHTRCVCIPNNEEIPHIFLCNRCEQEIVPLASLP